MREKLSLLHSDTMGITLILWLCSLPLIAFLVLPLFGRAVALSAALALLVVFLVFCWGLCGRRVVAQHGRER
jgi:hypothetical protein